MDSSQPTTPDFPVECSPPHFSYDLHSDSSGTHGSNSFGAFTNFGAFPDTSPRLGAFDTLTVNTSDKPSHDPSNCFNTPHIFPQSHSSPESSSVPHNFISAIKTSVGQPSTYQENFAISPLLTLSPTHLTPESGATYHQALSGHDADSLRNDGNSSATTCGQRQVRATGRKGSMKSPQSASRTQRPHGIDEKNRKLPCQVTTDADEDLADRPESADMEAGATSANIPHRRSNESKQQRIEAEQKRRNELREGYGRLKSSLPNTNRKSSKINLLDRAVSHIQQLEVTHGTLQSRLNKVESELTDQRRMNETLVRTITDPSGAQVAGTDTSPQTPTSAESCKSDSEPYSPADK